ncbi:aromatic alcohol reductase [Salinimonas sediminis]|uniref:Aromatic alcohol reductase n=1 Tax=Salinimonas sediminis TaxID=2303538 RepID=A0A346NKK1_9ALTE|nr:aromatic alcohol reductase [Salinimonas sediminis]AXR06058.1 aromatic alcohol reductase [Salinimonas sediminis]
MGQNLNVNVKKILIMGAGQLGLAVLNALHADVALLNGDITVLVSPASLNTDKTPTNPTLRILAEQGVKFTALDLAAIDHNSLVAFFAKFNTVVSCTGFVAGPGTQIKITRAVLEANVARYFPWQFGVDYDVVGKGSGQPVFDEQYEVRTMLRQQVTTEWVIVSTGMFTSFLFEPAFDVVNLEQGYINALGSWGNKLTVTAPEDIGQLTATIMLATPRIINEVVFVAGDTISYAELAKIVDNVSSMRIKRNLLPVDWLHRQLAKKPEDQMLRYRAAFALGEGMWWDIEKTFNYKNAIETQNTTQWLATHLR